MMYTAGPWRLARDDTGRRVVTGDPRLCVHTYAVSIVIRRGFASSRFGSPMVRTLSL